MRPIDADALIKHISDDNAGYLLSDRLSIIDIEKYIDDAPTIESVPVAHAHWVECESDEYEDEYKCSACGIQFIAIEPQEEGWKYCPCCGARMDEEGKDD